MTNVFTLSGHSLSGKPAPCSPLLCIARGCPSANSPGWGLYPPCISANLSFSLCLPAAHRAVHTALGAQQPPQLQLPRLLQSQLRAGQPSGECASSAASLPPHLSVLCPPPPAWTQEKVARPLLNLLCLSTNTNAGGRGGGALPSLEYYYLVIPELHCRVSKGPGEGCLNRGAGRWILLGRGSFEQWGECSHVHQCVVFL